ncbi:MAG TPA: DUF177 domain-containing protein [Pyrinomonadaceae bacterium]|nr:DUF177 domain-containing protein [Pyrinomonadaceae bacterium]
MRIELESLEGTDGRFAQTYEPGQLTLSDERVHLAQPAKVTGRIRQANGQVVVKGQISSLIQIECDRCLKFVEMPVEATFNLEYVTPQTYETRRAAELSERDMALSVFDGEAIDIDELVGEQLLLALPSRVLCQEVCKGLCPVCGADRNLADCACEPSEVDPRWTALKELVNGK